MFGWVPSRPSSYWNDIHQGTSAGSDSFVRAPWSCPGVLASRTVRGKLCHRSSKSWWNLMEFYGSSMELWDSRKYWNSVIFYGKKTRVFSWILMTSEDSHEFPWILGNPHEFSWHFMNSWAIQQKKHDFKSLHFWITTRLQVARLVLGIHGCQLCTSTIGFLMEISGLQCGSIRKNRESVCVLYIYISYIHVM